MFIAQRETLIEKISQRLIKSFVRLVDIVLQQKRGPVSFKQSGNTCLFVVRKLG